jgi:hypothetical protein
MYIVLPDTMGAASWPWFKPVENVNRTCSLSTFELLMSVSGLNRVFAASPAGVGHSPPGGAPAVAARAIWDVARSTVETKINNVDGVRKTRP